MSKNQDGQTKRSSSEKPTKGEGDYESARSYNRKVESFVDSESGQDTIAHERERLRASEVGDELTDAEREARQRIKETDPEASRDFDEPAGTDDSVAQRVAGKAHEAIDRAARHAEDFETRIRSRADQAGNRLEGSGDELQEQFEASLERAEAYIREQPLKAAGVAFAVGAIASLLLRR